jgi:hypothetical protein
MGRLWGHGYVLRYFDGVSEGLWMKRWRCVECRAVHTMRPASHWRGFWASQLLIVFSLLQKELNSTWLSGIPRQRQQYWWAGYRTQSRVDGLPLSVTELLSESIIAATHSLTYREIIPFVLPPHRIFAVTPGGRGP